MLITKNIFKGSVSFSELIKTKEFAGFIVAFLGAYFLFPYFFETHIYPLGTVITDSSIVTHINKMYPWQSLDPSWNIALNKFNIDGQTWGKDVTFTYGPLAYLSTRVAWGISKYHLLLFDLFVFFNFFCIFYHAYMKSENNKVALLIILATCIFLPSSFASGNALVLLAFLIFWIRQSLDKQSHFYYIMQIAVIVLLFFMKFNTSLISFFLFFVAIVYKALFSKENKLWLAGYIIIPLILIFFLSKILNVSLTEYLIGGLNMVSGYNEIMYLTMPSVIENKYTYAIIFITVFLIIYKMYLEKKQGLYKNIVILILYCVSIYVLYKQSFVRNDIQHILDFNKFSLLFILCIQDFYYKQIGKFSYWLMPVLVLLSFQFSKKRDDHLFKLNERVFKGKYIKELSKFSESSGMHLFPNANQIPDSIKNKIGNSTVDIYPYNIQLLLENKLNYKPRPASQSYTAYTPYLENLNFELYNSDRGPEYVLYEHEGIDNRYSLFDESKVNLVILNNYKFESFFNFAGKPELVLKKKPGNPQIKLQKIREFDLSLMDGIQPKADSYYEIFISNSFSGKISSVLSHAPEIFLIINTKDGLRREFKTSKKLLESGLFSNRYFDSTQDIYNYLLNPNVLTPGNEVVSYNFRVAKPGNFDNNINIIEYKIN